MPVGRAGLGSVRDAQVGEVVRPVRAVDHGTLDDPGPTGQRARQVGHLVLRAERVVGTLADHQRGAPGVRPEREVTLAGTEAGVRALAGDRAVQLSGRGVPETAGRGVEVGDVDGVPERVRRRLGDTRVELPLQVADQLRLGDRQAAGVAARMSLISSVCASALVSYRFNVSLWRARYVCAYRPAS